MSKIRYCPKCNRTWEKVNEGIYFHNLPTYGVKRKYCDFCLNLISVTNRTFLKMFRHAKTVKCPNCYEIGRYDTEEGNTFDDAVWWDFKEEKFRCHNCVEEEIRYE